MLHKTSTEGLRTPVAAIAKYAHLPFPIILYAPLIINILTLLSHSHHTSINSSYLSPATPQDLFPRMPWLHLSPPSPILATTAAPAHDPLIPTGTIIATARARDPVMQAVLAPPVVTETRAAQRELEPLSWEPRGVDYWGTRLEAARSGHWEAR